MVAHVNVRLPTKGENYNEIIEPNEAQITSPLKHSIYTCAVEHVYRPFFQWR